jgi:hypothetical protein
MSSTELQASSALHYCVPLRHGQRAVACSGVGAYRNEWALSAANALYSVWAKYRMEVRERSPLPQPHLAPTCTCMGMQMACACAMHALHTPTCQMWGRLLGGRARPQGAAFPRNAVWAVHVVLLTH